MRIVVVVEKDKVLTVGEAAEIFGTVVEKRRLSRILPKNPLLRTLFLLLRSAFGDEGRVADWTRRWKCRWVLVFLGEVVGEFGDRKEALRRELELLADYLLGDKSPNKGGKR